MASPSSVTIFGIEVKTNESIYIEIFNNPDKIYSPGQSVEGRMIVHTTMADEVKEIIIELEGKGHVQWTENKTHYSASEQYVYYKQSLFGDGYNLRLLPAGTLVHPFRFELPNDIPASFNSYIGEVTYTLKGEIKRSLFRMNDRAIVPLTVTGALDLNLWEVAALPQECMETKGSNFLCCREGNITLNLKLPIKSGFVPGEAINFQADITNGSNRRVTGTEAYLKQVVTFYSESGYPRLQEEVKIGTEGPEVEIAGHEIWSGSLEIPSTGLPPTRLGGLCRVIDLQYFLCVKVHIDGFSGTLKGKLPIVIGTIPLRPMAEDHPPSASGYNQAASTIPKQ